MVDQSETTANRQIKSEVLGGSSTGEVAVTEEHRCTQSNKRSRQRIKQMGVMTVELLQYNTAVKHCF